MIARVCLSDRIHGKYTKKSSQKKSKQIKTNQKNYEIHQKKSKQNICKTQNQANRCRLHGNIPIVVTNPCRKFLKPKITLIFLGGIDFVAFE